MLKELKEKLEALKGETRTLLAAGKVDEAEEKMVEVRSTSEMIERLEAQETPGVPSVAITTGTDLEARAAFNHYLRTGELRAMAVSSATKGAALAPVDFAKEIIEGLTADVVMRQLARILPPISGKSAAYPRRTGGSGAAMTLEGAPIVPYDLTFDQVVLTPKKAAALVEVSNELLQDEGVDLAGYLAQHFRDEIGELLEGQYLTGDATDANLQGILTADDGEVVPALLIERVPSTAAAIATADILALWGTLPAKYRKNATFVCNSAMETVLRGLTDGDGRYMMVSDLTSGVGNTLLGRPLVITDEFPGTLVAGTDALMVGDFQKGVYIADKASIDIQRNDSAGFYKDTTAFRAIFRTDIALVLPEAIKILSVKSN
jgi:HK97 family phage major capsid protein